jgi:hypothetical protein
MDWGDLFYPQNREKRHKLENMLAAIKAAMVADFDACNQLSNILNARVHTSFSPIYVNMQATIKENGDVLTKQLTNIQDTLRGINDNLKQHCDSINPDIFKQLQDPDLTFEKVWNILKPIEATLLTVIGGLVLTATST